MNRPSCLDAARTVAVDASRSGCSDLDPRAGRQGYAQFQTIAGEHPPRYIMQMNQRLTGLRGECPHHPPGRVLPPQVQNSGAGRCGFECQVQCAVQEELLTK